MPRGSFDFFSRNSRNLGSGEKWSSIARFPPDDDVEVPDSGGEELLEDRLDQRLELERIIAVVSDDRQHLFRNFFRERQEARPDSAGRDQGGVPVQAVR